MIFPPSRARCSVCAHTESCGGTDTHRAPRFRYKPFVGRTERRGGTLKKYINKFLGCTSKAGEKRGWEPQPPQSLLGNSEKGRREKPKPAAKDRALRPVRGRRRPGFARVFHGQISTESNSKNRRDSPASSGGEGREMPGRLFGQGPPKQRLQELIIFLSVLGYCWCPPRLPQ